ncbi:putative RNA-directed DNA polymerase [Helianthus annuus]|nr:putative RNA-directed DNA polymerase [Helianthus annuus]
MTDFVNLFGETLISKLEPDNPLYLHASDSTHLTVVNIKLKGTENYIVWANAMLLALRVKNKLGFVDGSIDKPVDDEVLTAQWERCNSVVLTWILNSVSEELYLGQVYSKLASEVWKDLKETYDKIDGSVVFNLYQKINGFNQSGLSVSEYYHKLNIMWKQLDQILQLPSCTCNASTSFNNFNQMIKLMQFLMGLDSVYQSVRTNLLTKESLPTVKEAFAIVSREESHRNYRNSGSDKKSQSVGFVSKISQSDLTKRTNKVSNQSLKCTNCNKLGHTVEKCFEIIGYPSWLKPRGGQGKKAIASSSNNVSVNDTRGSGVASLTAEQVSRLLNLLSDRTCETAGQSCNVSGSVTSSFCSNVFYKPVYNFATLFDNKGDSGWIVDSGANQHMVKSHEMLSDFVDVSNLNIKVKHPNGTDSLVTKIGSLKLTQGVILQDVSVVPGYSINLISVHKLAKDNKLYVGFDENTCYIQDLLTKKILVTGRQLDGLYFCGNSCKSVKVCSSNVNLCNLWHARLGHPSFQALKPLSHKLNVNISEDDFPCEICHKAKQHREPFPLSNHKTEQLGDLMHLDVWGPYRVVSWEGFKYFLTIVDDYTRAVWVCLMKDKAEVFDYFQTVVNIVKTQFGRLVKCIRSDNGLEFVNNRMSSFL